MNNVNLLGLFSIFLSMKFHAYNEQQFSYSRL